MNQTNILVVDDEEEIRKILIDCLSDSGYKVLEASDGNEALKIVTEFTPDLILLDIVMPKLSGFQLLRRIKNTLDIPVVVLSARIETTDKLEAFELGADDYITKPFVVEELKARIEVIIKRNKYGRQYKHPDYDDNYLKIELSKHRICISGLEIHLTSKEYDLLELLYLSAGSVLNYRQLLKRIWGSEYMDENELVQAVVKRLRMKIEPNSAYPEYIQTIQSVGYKFKNIE
jgi:DNA-binding response OmpR family regulator